MALIDSKQLNPKFTGSFTLSGSSQTLVGTKVEFTNANVKISGSATSTGSFGRLDVAGNSSLVGNLTIGGNITIGDADSDSISINADLTSNIIPNADSTYDIGSSSKNWRLGYIEQVAATHVTASGNISGSVISTGSFGQLVLSGGTFTSASLASAVAREGDITGVTAGNGLTGGGSSGGVSLAVGAGTGIDVSSGAVAVDVSDFMTNGSNNRIVTATGTDGMNAEANLTFDGTTLTVAGNLTVNGTTTTVNTTNTLVTDRFMFLNSGSSTGDGGIVVSNGIPNSGSAFAFDDSANRWGFSGSVGQSDSSITPDAYASAVVTSDAAYYRKNGNIRVQSGEIYIYVE